ncbi:MAG: PKD domain-containing protein, partial [Bacteroidia bacterium]|nr:PKD domain-containing protein [Bacteroidia bacterium]
MKKKTIHILFCLFFIVFFPVSFFAQSFVPSDLPGLTLWLTGDSVQVSTPPQIDKCFDLSPSLNHAVQLSSSLQPISVPAVLAGHKVMRFDGADDVLQFNPISNIRTVFWVLNEKASSVSNSRPLLGSSGSYEFSRGSNKEIWSGGNASSAILGGVTRVNSVGVNGTSVTISSAFSIISLVCTTNVSAEFISNDRNIPGRVWDGDIAEIIIYDQPLNAFDVQQVEQYLQFKYAPPANIGPDIAITNNFCDTVLHAGTGFNSYLWGGGEVLEAVTVSQSGVYWVQATDIFGYTSVDSVNVSISRPSFFQLTDTVVCNSSLTWNSGLNTTLFDFLWQDNSTDSLTDIIVSGSYSVTVTDSFGCSFSSAPVNVIIDNFINTATLGPDTFSCGPTVLRLLNNPAAFNPGYSWSDSSTSDSLFVSSSGQYWLDATSSNGCIKTDTVDITIVPIPVFDLGPDTTFCFYQNLILNPSIIGAYNYLWQDNSVSTTYSVVSSGFYKVKVQDSFGCNYTDSINVSIDSALFIASLGPDVSFCAGNSIALVSGAAPGLNYVWSDFSTNDSLSILFSGTYSVTVSDSNACSVSDAINVFIAGVAPTASFSEDTSCLFANTQFTDLSAAPGTDFITGWNWDFGDLSTSSSQSPLHIYADTGIYVTTLTVTTNIGCSSVLLKNIHVYPKPLPDFSAVNLCERAVVSFSDQSLNFGYPLVFWNWDFADVQSGTNNFSALQNPNHVYNADSVYFIQLIIKNNFGCYEF